LAFLDVASQGAARQPKRGEPEQSRYEAQGVGKENLGKSAGGAIIFDDQGQEHNHAEQNHGQKQHQPKAKSRSDRQE
jgi:hypothetical protein